MKASVRQGTHFGTLSPLALSAAEPSAVPALISPLQTATVTCSELPKASSALYHPQDPNPLNICLQPIQAEADTG